MRELIEKLSEARVGDPERDYQNFINAYRTAIRKLSVLESAARILSRKREGGHSYVAHDVIVAANDAMMKLGNIEV